MAAQVFAVRTLEISAAKEGPWVDVANAALSRRVLCTRTYSDAQWYDTVTPHDFDFARRALWATRPLGEFRIHFIGRPTPVAIWDLADSHKWLSPAWIRYPTRDGYRYMSGWPHGQQMTLGKWASEYRIDIRLVSDDEIVQPYPQALPDGRLAP